MLLRMTLAALAAFALAPSAAHAAESYDNCTGFIDSLPATVSTQGVWCLRRDLVTSIADVLAITVAGNNVTIDCNGFRLANTSGSGTIAYGIRADERSNVAVRNCNIRGFAVGIHAVSSTGGSQFIENNRVHGSFLYGIWVGGDGSVIRNNIVSKTGGSTAMNSDFEAIHAQGSVDILDNVISGVSGFYQQTGISTSMNIGGSVSRNRIRGLDSTGGFAKTGILNDQGRRMTIRDNDISSAGGFRGVICAWDSLAKGNIIAGSSEGIVGCIDAGDNDVSP